MLCMGKIFGNNKKITGKNDWQYLKRNVLNPINKCYSSRSFISLIINSIAMYDRMQHCCQLFNH